MVLIAVAPSMVLVASHAATAGGMAVALSLGVVVIVLGIRLVVVRPLQALQLAVDGWRAGQPFALPPSPLPVELRALALSFKRATRTLARREAQLKTAVLQQELAMQ